MVSPQITNPCGLPICGHCADQLVKNGSQNCHMCRQPRLGFCRNIFAEQLLVNIKLTCKGCRQELTLNEVKNHVTKDCMEIEIPCGQCQASIKRKDNIVHYGSCPKTKITCRCSLKIYRQDQEQHREMCRLAEVQCLLRCGSTVQRYLIPSHCLDCSKVVEQCPVRGCGQHFRKGEMQVHKKEKMERHISLMESERTGILWQLAKGRLAVLPQRSPSQQFVLTWTELGAGSGPLASPVFHKLQRRWRLYFQKGNVRLKYIQGLEDIAVVPSFFVKSRDDKTQAYLDLEGPKCVLLKEGVYIEIRIKYETTPKSITAKIAAVNPIYSYIQP